jgi:purine-binding chemotaxis protein CheW
MSEIVETVKKNENNNDTSKLLAMDDNYFQVIGFRLADEEFAVDIFAVKEIIRMPLMTRVPNAPKFVVGVVNMRGRVIPIIDLRIRFGLPKAEMKHAEKKIVVVEHENKTVGFLVDAVNEVISLNRSITEPPPPMVSGIKSDYITAIAKLDTKLLILLEISKILVLIEEFFNN